jgi:uncharacterized membrane protein YfcA
MWLVAVPVAVLIGLSLGALGGGGSILTVPALVYLLGQDSHEATTGSLVIVGVTALVAMVTHARAGNVRFGQGLLFAVIGIGGTWVGSLLSARVSQRVLLVGFAVVLLIAAASMLRRLSAVPGTTRPRPAGRRPLVLISTATGVGLVTGFFGVGGGFVVVPALVLALGLELPAAVGTSLLVIGLNSGIALATRDLHHMHLDWPLLLGFTAIAVASSVVGGRLAARVPTIVLGRWFAGLLIAVATYTGVRSLAGG